MPGRVRILVVGYRKFSELINALLPDFADEADIEIVEFVASEHQDTHDLADRYRADVIVSAGSNAAYLQATLAVPVLAQPVTDADVVEAIAKARRIAARVHVFTYSGEPGITDRMFSSLSDMLDTQIIHKTYTTTDEATESLLLALADDAPAVVVGPSYICRLAEQHNTPAILMYSKPSARLLLRRAIDVARSVQAGPPMSLGTTAGQFIVVSAQMQHVVDMAGRYARGRATVLIEGESGTGKEHVAREIHARSDYSAGPLVAVNCGTIPNELFESEFFGYVEGAFTSSRRGGQVGLIERANHGVLYLDEIGELPFQQQVKLLRALQERRIRPVGSNREISLDFKVIAATNRDLRKAVACGDFREDLYYRLNVFALQIPPLRDRVADVRAIFRHYLTRFTEDYATSAESEQLFEVMLPRLEGYAWPGNIRELQNFAERLVVNMVGRRITELSEESLCTLFPELKRVCEIPPTANGALKEMEFSAIADAMQRFDGDRQRVADHLGISPTTLWRRLKAYENR